MEALLLRCTGYVTGLPWRRADGELKEKATQTVPPSLDVAPVRWDVRESIVVSCNTVPRRRPRTATTLRQAPGASPACTTTNRVAIVNAGQAPALPAPLVRTSERLFLSRAQEKRSGMPAGLRRQSRPCLSAAQAAGPAPSQPLFLALARVSESFAKYESEQMLATTTPNVRQKSIVVSMGRSCAEGWRGGPKESPLAITVYSAVGIFAGETRSASGVNRAKSRRHVRRCG